MSPRFSEVSTSFVNVTYLTWGEGLRRGAGLQGALKVGDDDQEGSPTSSAEREARERANRV